jgi:hypothetical protein
MLKGLLNQEDYAVIGKRLKKARKRTEGNEDNYLLPGTPKYELWFSRETGPSGGPVEWVDRR